MIRYSNAFNIKKIDIGKSVILKYHKEMAEYWIYREKESRFSDVFGKNLKIGEKYLYCIIACDNSNNGYRQENEEFIAIEGVKFSNDDKGKDLGDYLHKTGGRSAY